MTKIYRIVSCAGTGGTFDPSSWLEEEGREGDVSPRFPRVEGLFSWLNSNGFAEVAGTMARKYTRVKQTKIQDKPCAAAGLTSYRYKGAYGWIMIGATDQHEALREALRSVSHGGVTVDNLQVWDLLAGEYRDVNPRAPAATDVQP